jgi:hypothetical protein
MSIMLRGFGNGVRGAITAGKEDTSYRKNCHTLQ